MTIRKIILSIAVVAMAIYWTGCTDDDDSPYAEIPDGPVSLTINLDLPLYHHMYTMGSFSYHDGGHKGVLLVHNFDDEYYAFERTCTHQPDLSCSRVEVDSLLINIRCGSYQDGSWEECCGSKFFFNGQVEQSPARFPLKQFPVLKSGSVLTVRN
jgi:hypothetical protein